MAEKNEFNWLDVLKGVAIIGGAIGLGYITAKGIDEFTNNLISMDYSEAAGALIKSVSPMQDEQWNLLQMDLRRKAYDSQSAKDVYELATYIRSACKQIDQILRENSIPDAVYMMNGILANRNDFEQAIFGGILQMKSQTDLKAESVLGYMKRSFNSG